MLIKEINIESFAGIKSKKISLCNGINVIYGENEVGKSSIQSFIKAMLYGLNSSRSKDIKLNDRVKYKPLTGELIRGELTINYNDKDIIIKRVFGLTKKDDICKVYYRDTGLDVENIDLDEPGKSFLGVSKNTFTKTLYIGQLDVSLKKDKEDDLLEKVTNILSSGDEGISVNKALEKLLIAKKKLITQRKTGEIDVLKDKLLNLNEERYEAYQLSKSNIENESSLIEFTEKNRLVREELDNLEIYKKYIKRLKLQKEYEEVTMYLRKSEELKEKKQYIDTQLTTDTGVIDEEVLNDLKEEHTLYLRLCDILEEENIGYEETRQILNRKKEEFDKFIQLDEKYNDYINNVKISLERLKNIRFYMSKFKNIKLKIQSINESLINNKKSIRELDVLQNNYIEIRELLSQYEFKLKELKNNSQALHSNQRTSRALSKLKRQKEVHFKLLVVSAIISFLFIILLKGNILSIIPSVILIILFGYLYVKDSLEIKKREKNNSSKIYILEIQNQIKDIEQKLSMFKEKLGIESYEEFIQTIKLFDQYKNFEDKCNSQIGELELMNSIDDYEALISEESDINRFIEEGISLLGLNSVEDLINSLDKYGDAKQEFITLEIKLKKDQESLSRMKHELDIREERIREKLRLIGLEDIKLIELDEKLLNLKEKIIQRRDIEKTLSSIEETYNILIKDKDLKFIEDDLKGFVTKEIKYSYETEEEIDFQIKKLSSDLIEIEKVIKDIENDIKNRFIGKREIHLIEEEIQTVKDSITEKQKILKATEIAYDLLVSSKDEIRGNFGVKLNNKILSIFAKFTHNKYNQTFISDNYDIMVKDENNIFTSELLSNGANDQLYLSVRLAFMDILFENKDIFITFDDAFVQYDDIRLAKTLMELIDINYNQILLFTCQNREKIILDGLNKNFNYISLSKREY